MKQDKNYSSISNGFLYNNKLGLYLTIGASLLVNVVLLVYFACAGIGAYIVMPIVMVVFTIALLLATIFSNFRFKYSAWIPVIVSILIIAFVVVSFLQFNANYFETLALIVFAAVNLITAISVILSMVCASLNFKANKFLLVAFSVICVAASSVYSAYVITNGYFGQGGIGYKNVYYQYDSATDTYIALKTEGNGGNKVNVADTFKGKKVSKISASLFTDSDVEEYFINSTTGFELVFDYNFAPSEFNGNIYVDKSLVDTTKGMLKTRIQSSIYYREYHLALMNSILPANLDADERYITFDYTLNSLVYADYKVIPTWIGNVNDSFSLKDHASDVSYIQDYNTNYENYLKNCYSSNKQALSTLSYNGEEFFALNVQDNMPHVNIDFETVYSVSIADSNDTKYSIPAEFKSFNGENYRYVVKSKENALINELPLRNGFTLSWAKVKGSQLDPFTNFVDALTPDTITANGVGNVTIKPVWSLNAPVINSISGATSYIYGDTLSLLPITTAVPENIKLNYKWYYLGTQNNLLQEKGTSEELQIAKILPSQSGAYKIEIFASSDTITSLVSTTVSQTAEVDVSKKCLKFNWSLPTDKVYNGEVKPVTATPVSEDVVSGDTINFSIKGDEVKNAGNYYFNITIGGDTYNNYYLDEETSTCSLEIAKRVVDLTWGATNEFVYSGVIQYNKVIDVVNAVSGDESNIISAITYSGYGKDVKSYNVVAALTHTNYKIGANTTNQTTITPAPISLTWGENEFIYNGVAQYPSVNFNGLVNGETVSVLKPSYTGNNKVNVGNYEMSVAINNSNYSIVNETVKPFTINKKPINLTWSNTSKVYNAGIQYPTYSVSGLVNGQAQSVLAISLTGSDVNVGNYTVTATLGNGNYLISSGATTAFEVTKRPITITWLTTTYTYTGSSSRTGVSYKFNNTVDAESALGVGTSYNKTPLNVGDYTISVSITNTNYVLEGENSTAVTITPKELVVRWGTTNLTYNGLSQIPVASTTGLVGSDTETSIGFATNGAQVNVGSSYTATASITSNNYTLTYPTKQFNIVKRNVTLVWEGSTFTYDGEEHNLAVTDVTNLVDGESISDLGLTLSDDKINVGNYTCKATITNGNYNVTNATKNFSIVKRNVTLVWEGDEFTYDGAAHNPVVTDASNLVSGQTIADLGLSYSAAQTNVGNYTCTIRISNNNYNVTNLTKQFSIVKRNVTLVWEGSTFTYDGEEHNLAVTDVTNLVDGESISDLGLTLSDDKINVGDYICTASISNGNYQITNATKEFSIIARNITLIWQGHEFIYNGTSQKPVVIGADNLVNDQTISDLSITYAGAGVNVGSYTCTATIANKNYNVLNPTYDFVVVKKSVSVSFAANNEIEYTGAGVSFEVVSSSVNGLTFEYKYYKNGTLLTTLPTEVGEYKVIVSLNSNNYELSGVTEATFVIVEVEEEQV